MRVILLAVFLSLVASHAHAVGYSIRGLGGASCASWTATPQSESRGAAWVGGYFTGRNIEGAGAGQERYVGKTTDFEGILAEIKLACSKAPSRTLESVTTELYDNLLAAKR